MLNKIDNWIDKNKTATYLLLFLLCFIFFAWLQYSPTFADPDSFYHTKIVENISEHGIVKELPHLQFTTLRDGYVDHHLLYHLYLVPFVKVLPPLVGVKLGHIILQSLVMLMFFWLLSKLKVYAAWIYVLFLLFVEPFIFRISLIKAQPLSLIILFLSFYLIVTRRYIPLAVLSFIYVWSYGGWFLIMILALIYVFVESLERGFAAAEDNWLEKIMHWRTKTLVTADKLYDFSLGFVKNVFQPANIKLIGSIVIGLTLGLVINPYFPKNLEFYYVHIIKIAFVNYQSVIGVGAEWYPYSVNDFFINSALPFALVFVAIAVFMNYTHKYSLVTKYALALFLAFVLATIKSRRNIEYLGPFAVIFSALVFSGGVTIYTIRHDFSEFRKSFAEIFLQHRYIKVVLGVLLLVVISVLFYTMPYHAKRSLDNGLNYNYLKSASQYLIENSEEGDIVLHSDWDEFPMLYFHNDYNYYIVGLDATFMYLYDKNLYEKWADITQGKRYKEMYNIVKNDFGAKYVIVTTGHNEIQDSIDNNFYFEQVYEDNEAVIYKVL
jgi:hypothetical protein